MSSVLDAVITPLNLTSGYIDRISKGDIPPQITDTYHGDFNKIKDDLNTLIVAMTDITSAAGEIAGRQPDGGLSGKGPRRTNSCRRCP